MTDEQDPIHTTGAEKAGEAAAIALSAVPYVGGPLAEIAKGLITRRQSRRLNTFLQQVADDLDAVKGRINAALGDSEDFQNFAEKIISVAEQTTQQEKLDALRAIFLNTTLRSPPPYDVATEITDLLMRLQPRHLVLLKILGDPARANAEAGSPVDEGSELGTSINQILRKLLPNWAEEDIVVRGRRSGGRSWSLGFIAPTIFAAVTKADIAAA